VSFGFVLVRVLKIKTLPVWEFPENAIFQKGIPREFPSIPDLGNSRFGRRAIPHTDPILWTTTVVNVYREVLP
jgi:hypothetical protein